MSLESLAHPHGCVNDQMRVTPKQESWTDLRHDDDQPNSSTEEPPVSKSAKPDKLAHLAAVPLFSGCTSKELKELARLCDEVDVSAGKVVVKQGSTGFECYIVHEGSLKVEIDGQLVTTLGPGTHFGEFAPIDKRPRSATVTAVTDATLLVLGPSQFSTALTDIPGFGMKLLATMAQRVREANGTRFSH
jgi:CRP-like cAMP-binding protein